MKNGRNWISLNSVLTSCLPIPFSPMHLARWSFIPEGKKKSIPIRIDFPFLYISSPSIQSCLQCPGWNTWRRSEEEGEVYSLWCPRENEKQEFSLSLYFFFSESLVPPGSLDCSGEFLLSYLLSWTRAPLCILTYRICINGSPDDEAVCFGLLHSLQTSVLTLPSQAPLEAWPTTLCISYLWTFSQTPVFQCQHLILRRQPRTTQTLILSKGYSLIPWAAYKKFHPIIFNTILLVLLTITKFIVLYRCVIHP